MFRQTARLFNSSSPVVKTVVKGSSFRGRVSSFLAGVAITGVFGYMRLREDVYASNADLKTRLQAAHSDVSVLSNRLQNIENRLNALETIDQTLHIPVKDEVTQTQN